MTLEDIIESVAPVYG